MNITLDITGDGPKYIRIISAIIGNQIENQSLIDLCCAECTITKQLPFKNKTYVDVLAWNPNVPNFIQTDVLGDHEVFNNHYDVANCSDGIEHLRPEQGQLLIERMNKLANKQILFTPLGPYLVEPNSTIPESHKSAWYPEDFPGFAAITCPNWHPTLNVGAFFVWKTHDIEADFERVKAHLIF